MKRVARRRLVEASAALDPPGRALLNLWLHRALSDQAIGEMAGLSAGQVAERKRDIIAGLSRELGVSDQAVAVALEQIASAPEGDPSPGEEATDDAEEDDPVLGTAASGAGLDRGTREPGALRSRSSAIPATVLALAIAAVIVVLILAIGRSNDTHHAAARSARTAVQIRQALRPLSSSAPDARGTAVVVDSGGTRALELTVSGLPPASGGHYEVWLYTTIIDSEPLGRLPNGVAHLTLKLPANAAAYRQIDVALQPPGSHYDSGESVLRAQNPIG